MIKYVILLLISFISFFIFFLTMVNENQVVVLQDKFNKKNRRFSIFFSLVIVIYGIISFQVSGTEGLPIIFLGTALLLINKKEIKLGINGIYTGLFFIEWENIEYYRWDRNNKSKLIIKIKKTNIKHANKERFKIYIPKNKIKDVNQILLRHV